MPRTAVECALSDIHRNSTTSFSSATVCLRLSNISQRQASRGVDSFPCLLRCSSVCLLDTQIGSLTALHRLFMFIPSFLNETRPFSSRSKRAPENMRSSSHPSVRPLTSSRHLAAILSRPCRHHHHSGDTSVTAIETGSC